MKNIVYSGLLSALLLAGCGTNRSASVEQEGKNNPAICTIPEWSRPLYNKIYSDCDVLRFLDNMVVPSYANIAASAIANGTYTVDQLIEDSNSGLTEKGLIKKIVE